MIIRQVAILIGAGSLLGACSSAPVLVFGQSHSVGIAIGGAASDAGAELSVGYKDRDIAVVPVAVVSKDGAVNQETMRVNSTVGGATDAMSVLGQFEVSAKAQTPDVGLGKFFATGLAAQKLADGFACKLGNNCAQPEGTPESAPATASR